MRLLRSLLAHWLISAGGGNGAGSGGRRCLCEPARPRSACRKQGGKPASPKAKNHFHFCRHGASSSQPQSTLAGSPPSPATKTNPSTNLHPLCLRQLFPTLIEFILCLGKSSGAPTGRPILYFAPTTFDVPDMNRTRLFNSKNRPNATDSPARRASRT